MEIETLRRPFAVKAWTPLLMVALIWLVSRLVGVVWWLFDAARWQVGFGNGLVATLAGLLALPWTTFAFVAVSPDGLADRDWVWLGIALLLDLLLYDRGVWGRSSAEAMNPRSAPQTETIDQASSIER